MTPAERALAVAITLGVWLGILARAVVVVIAVAAGFVVLCLFLLFGLSRTGRQAEYRTRPW